MNKSKWMFQTQHKENFKSKLYKLVFNLYPSYRRTGGRVIFLSQGWKEVHVKLPLNWKTRNYVGTVFGGSIYGALDPIYMLQLMNILGKDFVVWDKSAHVKFIKPINQTVYAKFLITDDLISEIKAKVAQDGKYVLDLKAYFLDKQEKVYAEVSKELYIADKAFYKNRKKK